MTFEEHLVAVYGAAGIEDYRRWCSIGSYVPRNPGIHMRARLREFALWVAEASAEAAADAVADDQLLLSAGRECLRGRASTAARERLKKLLS